METKKIEGYATGQNNGVACELGNGAGFCDFWECDRQLGQGATLATLVIFSGEREKVFTESEVRSVIESVLMAQDNYWDDNGHVQSAIDPIEVQAIAAKHGIQLT